MQKLWSNFQININNENWRNADSVLAQMNCDIDSYKTVVSMINSNIVYSDKSKCLFAETFKKLKNNMTRIVNQNRQWKEHTE